MIFQSLYLYLQGLHIAAGKYGLRLLEKLSNQFAAAKVNQRKFCFDHDICLTSLTCAKCGTRSTLCWKILNISDSTELFAL